MDYWDSAEVENSVYDKLVATSDVLEKEIVGTLQSGKLANIKLEICYIPIVMGPDFIEFYPARSKFDQGGRKLFHSPQLSFETFQNGTEAERKAEFLKGLLSAGSKLAKAGLTQEQISEFEAQLTDLAKRVVQLIKTTRFCANCGPWAAAHRRAAPRHGDLAGAGATQDRWADLAGINRSTQMLDRRTASRRCAAGPRGQGINQPAYRHPP